MKFTWHKWQLGEHTTRYRLYANGQETPWFVDKANCRAHFTQGEPCGLFGSGLGSSITRLDGSSYRTAGCFGAHRKVSDAKRRAMELAQ